MRYTIASLLMVLSSVGYISVARAALVPPDMLNSVVAIGLDVNVAPAGQAPDIEWTTLGTGFFYAYKVKDDIDSAKRQYEVYLVTAGHVVSEFQESQRALIQKPNLWVRINSKDATAAAGKFEVRENPSTPRGNWFFHPQRIAGLANDDIAAVEINIEEIGKLGAKVILSDSSAADVAKLGQIGVSAGDGVFVLGFPMNLAGKQRNYVIVRGGTIARISELIDKTSPTFMLDSFVFPGNSGSPVILKPEFASIQGTQANGTAYVIGVVIQYTPYLDIAVSQQTHRPRIVFEENSGLADVIPIDRVDEAIERHISSRTH